MNGVRILLLAFCLLVVIACGWTLAGVAKSLMLLKPQVTELEGQLEGVQSEERALSETWLDLDAKQRVERADYDGPEAVDASYETQLALEAFNLAKAIRQGVEAKCDSVKSEQRHTAGWITPLIVLGFIHLVLLAGLWPKRKPHSGR